MELNKQNENITIYPSTLRAFSYAVLGSILLTAGVSFIASSRQIIYIIILFIIGSITALYGIINLVLRKYPVVLFDKFGFLYSTFARAKLFIPKDMIMAVSLRNTPNKRLIITLKPIEQDYKKYLKNIRLPSHLQTCQQSTAKLRGNKIIIPAESLNADNAALSKQFQKYLNNQQ